MTACALTDIRLYAILYIKVLYSNELNSIMKGPILKITLDS